MHLCVFPGRVSCQKVNYNFLYNLPLHIIYLNISICVHSCDCACMFWQLSI